MANRNELLEAYITGMQERAYPDEDVDIENLRTAYFSPDSISLMMTALEHLKSMEIPSSRLTNDRCRENVKVVGELVGDLGPALNEMGINVLLGGSTIYNAPKKGDIDILIAGDRNVLVDAEDMIQRHMKARYGYRTDLDDTDPREFLEFLETPGDPRSADAYSQDILWSTSKALKVLTWRPVLQNGRLSDYRAMASNFLTGNKLATATACMRLNWSIKKIARK